MEILPLPLSRHVLKAILGRPITWYDMAFYDTEIFDSLRSIAYNETTGAFNDDAYYEDLGLYFTMEMPPEEARRARARADAAMLELKCSHAGAFQGGGSVELKPGGENIPVTRENVLEYLYLYVEKRLLGQHTKALDALRQGVYEASIRCVCWLARLFATFGR